MAKVNFTGEDKRALRLYVRNLPVMQKLGADGKLAFFKSRMRGDKAIHKGYKVNDKGEPLDPRGYYVVPTANALVYPYEWFLKKLREKDEPVTEAILDELTREYLAEYARVAKVIAEASGGSKQETNPTSNNQT